MRYEHYDSLETRDPDDREREFSSRLPDLMAIALRAPGWATQLAGIDPHAVTSRAALAKLPVLRKSELVTRQKEVPPFGGFNVTAPAQLRRLLMSPGPIFEPEGKGKDFWGAARMLFAAGFRSGDVVHNSFSYHLTPGGFIMESGAHALGCAVIPAGTGNTEQQLEAIAHFKPSGYLGTPDYLKILLDAAAKAGKDASSLRRALVSGAALPHSLRQELAARGVEVRQCYATADLGVIAYESEGGEGMIVNETLLVEIVRPGTGDPVAAGEVGEVVVTSFNPDYPMIRLATGDLSAVLPGPSPCGRTNMRLAGWMGRADQTTKVKGMFVHPAQVAEIGKRHPELGRLRLVVTRAGEQDAMTLMAECAAPAAPLQEALVATLRAVTKLGGEVKLVAPGSLPNDGKVIADERPVG
ncbi:MAG: phenylacetate--CoA ligase family protein [Xanthobacteraceae bacterium]|jgi:phenylacetate-coenzyme A ligase PaaK-like adenylate-forming protein